MKPILFNTDMVCRLLNGAKTVTRRVVKEPYYIDSKALLPESGLCMHRGTNVTGGMPYPDSPYHPGNILYVRETWQQGFGGTYLYKADAGHDLFMTPDGEFVSDIPWRPSIHMPREAARIFLRVTGVRVERLQDITPDQIDAEGCKEYGYSVKTGKLMPSSPIFFGIAWDNTIKKSDRALYGWDANPWVWVIEFERIGKEQAQRKS